MIFFCESFISWFLNFITKCPRLESQILQNKSAVKKGVTINITNDENDDESEETIELLNIVKEESLHFQTHFENFSDTDEDKTKEEQSDEE